MAKYHSPRQGGRNAFFSAMTDAERVGDEIVEKMIADSKNGHPLFHYSLNTTQNVFVQPQIATGDLSYVGWMYLFSFANAWRNCITHPSAPNWSDTSNVATPQTSIEST